MPQNFNNASNDSDVEITVAELYPQLSLEEQAAAEDHLLGYLAVIKQIFERVAQEEPEILTELEQRAMLRKNKAIQDKN